MVFQTLASTTKMISSLLDRRQTAQLKNIALFGIFASVFEVATTYSVIILAQSFTSPDQISNYFSKIGMRNLGHNHLMLYSALLFGTVFLIKNVISGAEITYQNTRIQDMCCKVKIKLLEKIMRRGFLYNISRNSVEGIEIIDINVENTFSSVATSLCSIFSEAMVFFLMIGFLVYTNVMFAITLLSVGATLAILVPRVTFSTFYRIGQNLQESGLKSYSALLQLFQGHKEILMHQKTDYFSKKTEHFLRKKSQFRAQHTILNSMPRLLIEMTFVIILVISVWFLVSQHQTAPQIVGTLGGYLYAGFRLMPGLNRLISGINMVKLYSPYLEKTCHEYFFEYPRQQSPLEVENFRFEHSIVFRNVTFSYPDSNKYILKNFSLTIHRGESVGIIGKTGSGKSTFIDLFLGLISPLSGEISIDGRFPANSKQWQTMIGYVPQQLFLLDDTIANNIAFGVEPKHIDFNRLSQVIEDAQLHSFVSELPLGIHTIVGERGVRLSGGERQRIAIARALYHNPSILVLDEATSALDHHTEMKLMETINHLSKGRTLIMVAHRLSTLKACGKILKFKNGTIEKEVSYAELSTEG